MQQRTAWFLLQRIREVIKIDNNTPFSGITEIDEAYLGGSETNAQTKKNKPEKPVLLALQFETLNT